MAEWDEVFKPAQRDVEAIGVISRGKVIQQPMALGADGTSRNTNLSPATPGEGFRRTPSGLISGTNSVISQQRPQRISSATPPQPSRPTEPDSNPGRPDYLTPTDFTTAVALGQAKGIPPGSLGLRTDNTRGSGQPSPAPSATASHVSFNGGMVKKRPPPPPPKRISSGKLEEFVVAQYDFGGQGKGDLSFRAGDRIKIVQKTDTDQDWWVGELSGIRGNFPANYCKST